MADDPEPVLAQAAPEVVQQVTPEAVQQAAPEQLVESAPAPAEDAEEARQRRIREAVARGDAPIKPEYLLPAPPRLKRPAPAEATEAAEGAAVADEGAEAADGPAAKRQKGSRGMNKAKDRLANAAAMKAARASQLCSRLAYLNACNGGQGEPRCSQVHDVEAFLAARPAAIAPECPVLKAVGICPAGLNCRFGGHVADGKNVDRDGVPLSPESPWVEKVPSISHVPGESNVFSHELVGKLRKGQLDFSRSKEVVKSWHLWQQETKQRQKEGLEREPPVGCLADRERRKLDLAGKTVLAPLTTVGNLPFRRLCVKLGCEVTVGEMALASTVLDGGQAELALLRRHESEQCFGVQIAGGDLDAMTRVAQFVDEHVDCDFLDINCGCPLDEVHRRGAGTRLMQTQGRLESIVRCMSSVLQTKALTLKMRTAHLDGEGKQKEFAGRYAHRLVPLLEEWGVSAIVLHGRTARQRYTKLADWDYMRECGSRRRRSTPFIGCGDVMNWEDVEEHCNTHGVDACMIGRGALVKPWLFTEIAEKRHWDISASERLDMIKDYASYGLEHWGSDSRGVETTRRFLLEWISFTSRYVPVGLLETLPARINWRPPPFVGRNDLETKLASNSVKDWVELSEMVLGKVPEGFSFVPKHKSASYEQV